MKIDKNKNDNHEPIRIIPLWLKTASVIFLLAWSSVFIHALTMEQTTILGLEQKGILIISLSFLILFALTVISFFFYPTSSFSQTLFYLLCVFNVHIYILALLGIIYLITIRLPILSLRGGFLYIMLLLVFGVGFSAGPVWYYYMPRRFFKPTFLILRKVISGLDSTSTWQWSIAPVLLPVLLTFFVVYIVLDSNFSRYGPFSFWNDEVGYWIWLRSFVHVGLSSGYNAPNELLPVFEFSRYGEASPFYLYIYGAVGRVVGWFPSLPIVVNFLVIAISLKLFVRSLKLSKLQILFLCLSVVCTWPILLYLPMTTHETLNQAIGITLALIFIKLLTHQNQLSLKFRYLFFLLVYFATFVRLSWGILLIPVLFYSLRGSLFSRGVISLFLGSILYVLAIVIMGYLLPPTNNSILDVFRGGLQDGPRVILEKIYQQIFLMFWNRELTPNIGVTFQILVVIAWSALGIYRSLHSTPSSTWVFDSFDVFNFYNMVFLLIAGMIFYLQGGFYRIFAPVMLIVYLIMVFRKDYRHLSALLMINVIFFPFYMNYYHGIGDFQIIRLDYSASSSPYQQLQTAIEKFVVYDSSANDPWCNTLLIPLSFYDGRLTAVPPGIGISYILQPSTFQHPIKSLYVWLDPESYKAIGDLTELIPLASLPDEMGTLYLNADAYCRLTP